MRPRQNSVVRVSDYRRKELKKLLTDHPDLQKLLDVSGFWFLGEIPNMPDFCLVCNMDTQQISIETTGLFEESIAPIHPALQNIIKNRWADVPFYNWFAGENSIFKRIRLFFNKGSIGSK